MNPRIESTADAIGSPVLAPFEIAYHLSTLWHARNIPIKYNIHAINGRIRFKIPSGLNIIITNANKQIGSCNNTKDTILATFEDVA